MVRIMSEILLCSEPAVLFQSNEMDLLKASHFEKKILPYENEFKDGLMEDLCTLISVLSKDELGQFIFKSLEESENNLSQCKLTSESKSAIWFETGRDNPTLQTPLSAINELSTGMINNLDLYRYRHLHLSGNLLCRSQRLNQSLSYLIARAKRVHLTVSIDIDGLVDVNQISPFIERVDWFVVDTLDFGEKLSKLGANGIVVRHQELGAYVYEKGNEIYIPGSIHESLAEFSGQLIHYYLQTGRFLMSVRQAMNYGLVC